MPLNIYVNPAQWDDNTRRVRTTHPNYREINALLASSINKVEQLALQNPSTTPEHIIRLTSAPPAQSFNKHLDSYLVTVGQQHSYNYYKRTQSLLNHFNRFAPSISFNELTPVMVSNFEKHLFAHGLGNNTVMQMLASLRTILNKALETGVITASPMATHKLRYKKSQRLRLTMDEIGLIEALDIEEGTLLWHVRNWYLFSFYCAGIRFGDLCTLTADNLQGGRLIYTMGKTGTRKPVKLSQPALDILSYYNDEKGYIFPVLPHQYTGIALVQAIGARNAMVNKYLKKLAKAAGIDKAISFHTARHSFADYAVSKKLPATTIRDLLGHHSLKITEQYLKDFYQDESDEAIDVLFK